MKKKKKQQPLCTLYITWFLCLYQCVCVSLQAHINYNIDFTRHFAQNNVFFQHFYIALVPYNISIKYSMVSVVVCCTNPGAYHSNDFMCNFVQCQANVIDLLQCLYIYKFQPISSYNFFGGGIEVPILESLFCGVLMQCCRFSWKHLLMS